MPPSAHHDGGVDERNGLLAGLVGRADLVLFPVDCISHDAALTVKRLCRQLGKPFRAAPQRRVRLVRGGAAPGGAGGIRAGLTPFRDMSRL